MSTDGPLSYQGWRELGFQLVADLDHLARIAEGWSADDLADEARRLRARVVARRFTLAVVGEFKRGKSTFINALMGEEVLPADVAPTTATVNRVTYGLQPGVQIHYRDGRPPVSVSIDALTETVTKLSEASAAHAASVSEAVVTYPVRFCRNDVDIVDTPGLGDESTMTAVTMELLPTADAAVLVIMSTAPFSQTESEFLSRLLSQGIGRLIVVVSAMDRIRRARDRTRLLDGIRQRLVQLIESHAQAKHPDDADARAAMVARYGQLPIYGVSALDALEGRLEDDPEMVSRSGMLELEAALETFLTTSDLMALERQLGQLSALCDQLLERSVSQLTDPPGPVDGLDPERVLAGYAVLVDLLAARAEAHARGPQSAEALVARTMSGLDELQTHLASMIGTAVSGRLREHAGLVEAAWPNDYPAFVDKMVSSLHGAMVAAVSRLLQTSKGLLDAPLTQAEALAAQEFSATRVVLRRVAVLSHPGATPAWAQLDAAEDHDGTVPSLEQIARRLVPGAETLTGALVSPELQAALNTYNQSGDFNRFMSYGFGGIGKHWQQAAAASLEKVLYAHAKAHPASPIVQRWFQQQAAAELAMVHRSSWALSQARLDLRSHLERGREAASLRQQARHKQVAEIKQLQARLVLTRDRLSASG